ncbi:MAG TPA: hypothetical protein VFR78_20530 [Pyrinomonadaceae bacterium]|nr:hypothetical protein [Pyrinomonadaceae bacterium]
MPPKTRPKPETVYDATDVHLRSIIGLTSGASTSLTPSDLAKPEIVLLLLSQHEVTLTEIKTHKADNSRLQDEIRNLIAEREQLRIDLAKAKERRSILLLEVPMSILIGFATKMLTVNPLDGIGWVLLLIGLVMLLMVRKPFHKDGPTRTEEHDSSRQN